MSIINLKTAVNAGLSREVVACELQLRTLLQESWGELTHEDTYKPGSSALRLVTTLSRRMADLLATLDDMAEISESSSTAYRMLPFSLSPE